MHWKWEDPGPGGRLCEGRGCVCPLPAHAAPATAWRRAHCAHGTCEPSQKSAESEGAEAGAASFSHSLAPHSENPAGQEAVPGWGSHRTSETPSLAPAASAMMGAAQLALSFPICPTCPHKFFKRKKAFSFSFFNPMISNSLPMAPGSLWALGMSQVFT